MTIVSEARREVLDWFGDDPIVTKMIDGAIDDAPLRRDNGDTIDDVPLRRDRGEDPQVGATHGMSPEATAIVLALVDRLLSRALRARLLADLADEEADRLLADLADDEPDR